MQSFAAFSTQGGASCCSAIKTFKQNKKILLGIAHRLKTIKGADKILVLDRGKLIEQGNHEQLMKSGGLYSDMVNIQSNSAGWTLAGVK